MNICRRTILLTTVLVWGSYSEMQWETNYLNNYKVIPILGNCYQLYEDRDLASTCKREPDLRNQACIQWVFGENQCLGLITPTNETVVFRCTSHLRFDNCFEVYDNTSRIQTVCQKVFNGHSVGITTPDNFTIIFHDELCTTTITVMERQVYSNFLNNYWLNADTKSCYKVYEPDEVATPYNCLDEYIYEACVFTLSGGCTALTTQNNEVLVLDCPDKSLKPKEKNCFYLYTPDNEVYTVCQEKLEERCIGVFTPSNLTVLFECFSCSNSIQIIYYNDERRRKYRQFVKNYLENEYLGLNSHLLNFKYRVFNNNQYERYSKSLKYVTTRWIPKTSCLGITLDANETIILECVVPDEKQEQLGCFQVISPDNEKASICANILSEDCVGLTTTNVSVVLMCYHEDMSSLVNDELWNYYHKTFSDIVNNKYQFRIGDKMKVFKETKEETLEMQVQVIPGPMSCIGIIFEKETLVLNCESMETKKNGCFNVIKTYHKESDAVNQVNVFKYGTVLHLKNVVRFGTFNVRKNEVFFPQNTKIMHILSDAFDIFKHLVKERGETYVVHHILESVESVCIRVLDSGGIGIITPDYWVIPFSYVPMQKSNYVKVPQQIGDSWSISLNHIAPNDSSYPDFSLHNFTTENYKISDELYQTADRRNSNVSYILTEESDPAQSAAGMTSYSSNSFISNGIPSRYPPRQRRDSGNI